MKRAKTSQGHRNESPHLNPVDPSQIDFKPTVSVVIATYNYAQYLPEAIESVLAQTFQDFEIIIVDDGSTDDTQQVVESFLTDKRIAYHRIDHLGQPKAKNFGIRQSSGEFVAFLDADDLWLSTKLEKQISLFRNDPELGVIYCRRTLIDPNGHDLPTTQPSLPRGHVLKQMFQNNFVCFSSCMIQRNVFDNSGLFNETIPLAIDYDLWLRVARQYRFNYVDEPLVKYRTGHANLSCRGIERLHIVLDIMDRSLCDHETKIQFGGRLIRQCYAETYAHLADSYRSSSRIRSFLWYLRSIFSSPLLLESWRGIASLLCPAPIRHSIQKLSTRGTIQSQ